MQTKIYNEDQGEQFGQWKDTTSQNIYFDSVKDILSLIEIPKRIADYGGANGILKQFLPNIITIDIDPSKKPDIVDNILTHVNNYDLIIIRFVLHYLNDYEILELFNHLKTFHKGKILIIQFTNEDLKTKYYNSQNETKYFRTLDQLKKLLPECKTIYQKQYTCSPEFYKNRLNIDNAIEHLEHLNAFYL